LLPSLPKDAEDETQMGFQLIVLPYADDIRELDRIMEASGYPKDRKEDEPSVID